MRRLPIAILLILALVLGPLAPVQAGWACPDGTPCVADQQQGFRCAGGECSAPSCCLSKETQRCHHGALPGVAAHSKRSNGIQGTDHCQYTQADRPILSALQDGSRVHLTVTVDLAFTPGGVQIPNGVVSSAAWIEDAYGYRPPPLLSTGPARAPPSL